MTCEHTVPFEAKVVTVTAPPYACIFCELTRLQAEVVRLEAELKTSDELRAGLHNATVGVAADMVRALNLVESAFYRGLELQATGDIVNYTSPDAAYREFAQEIMK